MLHVCCLLISLFCFGWSPPPRVLFYSLALSLWLIHPSPLDELHLLSCWSIWVMLQALLISCGSCFLLVRLLYIEAVCSPSVCRSCLRLLLLEQARSVRWGVMG